MKNINSICLMVVALIFASLLVSCEYETIQPEKEAIIVIKPGEVIKFSEKVLPLYSKYSCTGCHPTTKGLDFNTANAYTSTLKIVNKLEPTSSLLYVKLSSTHQGKEISSTERSYLLEWIKEGALNN